MATKRIKDISTTATTFAADDFIALDASSVGTRKMAKASLITQVGANYLEKADNLSDVASKDTSKLNLEVPNVGTAANEVSVNGMLGNMSFQNSEAVTVDDLTVDGQLTAAVGKPMPVNGPTMRFDGSNDYVEFADNDAFSFTNGTDDTPFSVSAWVKMEDATSFPILAKYSATVALREFRFQFAGDDRLAANLSDTSGNLSSIQSDETWTALEGQWVHVAMTYAGSANLSTAADGLELYLNGKLLVTTKFNSASYTGMTNTAQPLWVGQQASVFAEGEIRDVKLFNKELSAAEVKEVYSNGQLPESFAESTGAIAYVSDFSAGVDGFTASAGTAAGNIDSIGGQDDNLRLTIDTSTGYHALIKNVGATIGKRYRVSLDYYIPSANTYVDGILPRWNNGSFGSSGTTLDAWTHFSFEDVATAPDFEVYAEAGGSISVTDPTGTDVLYIRNVTLTQIGSVLDARAENYNQSAGKLLDVSGNDFVGTQSGGVELLTPRSHLSAGTLDLTNLPTSATGLSAGEVYNDSGTLKIV